MRANDFIIVIGRQYGSGGREIGKILANRLGIAYYDKELLGEAARHMGFREEIFAKADERKPSIMRSIISLSFGAVCYNSEGGLSPEVIYERQSNVIRAIAKKGACVIVGRTADYILRESPRMTSIFIHADINTRAKKIMGRMKCKNLEEAAEIARKRDKLRQGYYNYFTGRQWGAADNYDMALNASTLPADGIAEIIISYLLKRDLD